MNKRWTKEDLERKGLNISKTQPLISSNSRELKKPASFALGRMKAGKMNKTEAAYAKYLELQKQFGKVLWYEFEPMNLRLADKCFFNVDFLVMVESGQLECHEIKGYLTDDSLVKFKVASNKFPFKFRMFQLKKAEWVEIYSN